MPPDTNPSLALSLAEHRDGVVVSYRSWAIALAAEMHARTGMPWASWASVAAARVCCSLELGGRPDPAMYCIYIMHEIGAAGVDVDNQFAAEFYKSGQSVVRITGRTLNALLSRLATCEQFGPAMQATIQQWSAHP